MPRFRKCLVVLIVVFVATTAYLYWHIRGRETTPDFLEIDDHDEPEPAIANFKIKDKSDDDDKWETTFLPKHLKVYFKNSRKQDRDSRAGSHTKTVYEISQKEKYLRLVHEFYNVEEHAQETSEARMRLENIIRSGYGLNPYTSERDEPGWIENGIVYRPWRKPEPEEIDKTHPAPNFTKDDYEVYVPFNETEFFQGRKPPPDYKVNKKVIAWHTPTRYATSMTTPGPMKGCPEFPCLITSNRQYVAEASGVLFAAQLIKGKPPVRTSPDQAFVLHNHEPPFQNQFWDTHLIKPEWKSVFNWTMTYRMDSDMPAPYAIVRRRPIPLFKDYEAIVAKKTKLAVWIVSNCQTTSLRRHYVKELKKYVDVDIYGACGKLKCPHATTDKCAAMITTKYKFYLGLESSFCPDYISEKFFHFLNTDAIVVARGTDGFFQHAPSEIFLNTADFPSPRALADRMKYLDQNPNAYIAMLREKNKYTAIMDGYPVRNPDGYIRSFAFRFDALGMCRLCQRLWNVDAHRKSIPDILQWFLGSKQCYKPPDL